jgi:exosortase/archaeosortase family protein
MSSVGSWTRAPLGRSVVWRIGALFLLVFVGNHFLANWLTTVEAGWSVRLSSLAGVNGLKQMGAGNLVFVPHSGGNLVARVSPSCSCLTSALAIGGLSFLVLGGGIRRRVFATLVAVGVVVIGNVLRIGVVLWIGTMRGRDALVLFHDWVGTLFSISYTLVGFLTLIALRLPNRRRWTTENPFTFGM